MSKLSHNGRLFPHVFRADPGHFIPRGSTRWVGDAGDLHPDTEPAAIARDQRAAVRAALGHPGRGSPVPAVLAAAVVLPVWVVARRLRELGYAVALPAPFPAPPNPARPDVIRRGVVHARRRAGGPGNGADEAVRAFLARVGRATAPEVAAAAGLHPCSVTRVLVRVGARVVGTAARRGSRGAALRVWGPPPTP